MQYLRGGHIRSLLFAVLAASGAFASFASNANAQPDSPHAAANVVVPPRLKTDSPASYPEQALKDHVRERVEVVLILDIDEKGQVRNAVVDGPVEHGFDAAALLAAKGLVFEPATRGGQPIAAKIRFKYAFDPPPAQIVGRIARQATDSPIAGARIVVRDARGGVHETTTATDGTYRITGIPHGPVKVHVEAKNQKPVDLDEDLSPGTEASIVVRLTPEVVEAPPPPPPGVDESEIEEVRVRAERPPREVTKRTLSKEEIILSPGSGNDALRAIQNLPGVARPPPFGGQLIIRGAGPNDTGYFFDGTNVPIAYHFGGLSSVVPTELVDRIDFYPGNFGATYGRGMGGVIDVAMRGPRDDGKLHGMIQLDSVDVRALAERSLGKGWSFLVAGRRSYFDLWLKVLTSGGGISTAPKYYDYQAMLRKELGRPDHDLRFAFFGSDDRIEIFGGGSGGDFILGGNLRAALGFWRAQARYQNRVSSGTRITAVAAIGQDFVDFGFGEDYIDLRTLPIQGRAEISQRIVKQVTVNAGIDIQHIPYEVTLRFPKPEAPGAPASFIGSQPLFSRNTGSVYMPAAYGELEIVPVKGTRLVPGYRADFTNITKEWNHSPRVSARQDLHGNQNYRTTAKGGVGYYFQPPSPFELDPVFGQAGLVANRSVHYAAGLEQMIGPHMEISVEGFYKELDRLVVIGNRNNGEGRIWGTETLVRWKNDPKFFGWIAYTISRSERRDRPEDLFRVFQYDQTHVFTILGSRDLGNGFRVGGRFRVISGNLFTPNAYDGPLDLDRASYQSVGTLPLFGERAPAFHQLDLRMDKSFVVKPLSKFTVYFDWQNVYAYRSVEGTAYNYNYTLSQPIRGLPGLTIIGLRADL